MNHVEKLKADVQAIEEASTLAPPPSPEVAAPGQPGQADESRKNGRDIKIFPPLSHPKETPRRKSLPFSKGD